MRYQALDEDRVRAIDDTVESLLADAGCVGPPINALELAEELGLWVAVDRRQSARGRLVRLARPEPAADHGAILLRPDPRPERRQWACAHELGEHRAWEVFGRLGIDVCDAPDAAREAVANQFAARLLLPTQWFRSSARDCDWDMVALKQEFLTASHELIARRMLDLEPPVVITVFDHGKQTWRLSNRLRQPPPLTSAEQSCWNRAHVTGVACEAIERGMRAQAWPIHEPEWRREVVRLELSDE